MNRYIGSKIIHAEPLAAINPVTGNAEEGYSVRYEDGYISWSPKAVFEKAYRPAVGMSFGMALEALKTGLRVSRVGWKTGFTRTYTLAIVDGLFKCETDGASWSGWFPTNLDMLADDWITV
jgi:hypothetical protein